ncbi:unnamed protein product, partial [Didymodactylos carnosus]
MHVSKRMVVKLKQKVKNLNLFEEPLKNDEERIVSEGKTSTRVFVVLLSLSVFVLILYYSIAQITILDTKELPSLAEFEMLQLQFQNTLNCPCSQISILYRSFISMNPRLHQVCSSSFVSNEYIKYLVDIYYTEANPTTAATRFQMLADMCQLANDTITDSLNLFYSSAFISGSAIRRDLFESQVDAFINVFGNTTTNSFARTLSTTRSLLRGNQLVTGTSSSFDISPGNTSLYQELSGEPVGFISTDYDNCTCVTDPRCATDLYLPVFNGGNVSVGHAIVPGFFHGCYEVEALLMSDLRCFYNYTCLSPFFEVGVHVTVLDSSIPTIYQQDANTETLLDNLFLETWNSSSSYSSYYNACAPLSCTYTASLHRPGIDILQAVIGLYGGLSTGLMFLVPVMLDILRSLKKKYYVPKKKTQEKHDVK